MILIETNALVYTIDALAPRHEPSRRFVEAARGAPGIFSGGREKFFPPRWEPFRPLRCLTRVDEGGAGGARLARKVLGRGGEERL
ncbi:hypothetical protein DXX99_00355 [Ammonifex thiophilus]|uniref:Uncharacterized protein n=1 Tax=Ammonifex thiophilus TaxID=444093 RepID=A0A3D8P5E8_9THEO|nr:hypothetical protein DXX99_00355 [Ammonifex thiophilus]